MGDTPEQDNTVRLRATLMIRNEDMISARKALGLSQKRLADESGVSCIALCKLEKLDYTNRNARKHAALIAEVLGLPVYKILPKDADGKSLVSDETAITNVSVEAMIGYSAVASRMITHDPLESLIHEEEKEKLEKLIEDLPEKQKRVIRMRHGLETGREMGYREIGKELSVTGQTAHNIEYLALRNLKSRADDKFAHQDAKKILSKEDIMSDSEWASECIGWWATNKGTWVMGRKCPPRLLEIRKDVKGRLALSDDDFEEVRKSIIAIVNRMTRSRNLDMIAIINKFVERRRNGAVGPFIELLDPLLL